MLLDVFVLWIWCIEARHVQNPYRLSGPHCLLLNYLQVACSLWQSFHGLTTVTFLRIYCGSAVSVSQIYMCTQLPSTACLHHFAMLCQREILQLQPEVHMPVRPIYWRRLQEQAHVTGSRLQ